MENDYVKYIIFSLGVFTITFLLQRFHIDIFVHNFWYIFGFIFLTTTLSLIIFKQGFKRDAKQSVSYSLVAIAARMLLSMFFVAIFLFFVKSKPILFITNFFFLYFLFTVFELTILLRTLRTQTKN